MENAAKNQPQLTELRRIRHEINNALTGVIGHTQLLLMRGEMDAKSRERVGKIEALANRIKDTVQHIAD